MKLNRIDELPSLRAFDLLGFNGGVEPWPSPYIYAGFGGDAERFRKGVRDLGMAHLGRVADVACGFGRWAIFLAEVNDQVVGYDRNSRALDLAERLARRFEVENISYVVSDATTLDEPPASFDGACCINSLHFLHRGRFLTEMNRILRENGRLALAAYNGAGTVLQKFFQGYKAGGVDHPNARYALQCLKGGPRADAEQNYADGSVIGEVLEDYGFKLAEAPRITRRPQPTADVLSRFDLSDLSRLAGRILEDAEFAEAFASCPDLANAFPVNLDVVCVKVCDLRSDR